MGNGLWSGALSVAVFERAWADLSKDSRMRDPGSASGAVVSLVQDYFLKSFSPATSLPPLIVAPKGMSKKSMIALTCSEMASPYSDLVNMCYNLACRGKLRVARDMDDLFEKEVPFAYLEKWSAARVFVKSMIASRDMHSYFSMLPMEILRNVLVRT